MQLWLKGDKTHSWSLYQVNNIPTAINGWNIVMILAASVYVDATGRRMTVVAINLVCIQISISNFSADGLTGCSPFRNYLSDNLGNPSWSSHCLLSVRRI
jgi:hypothetical protein